MKRKLLVTTSFMIEAEGNEPVSAYIAMAALQFWAQPDMLNGSKPTGHSTIRMPRGAILPEPDVIVAVDFYFENTYEHDVAEFEQQLASES